VVSKSKWISCWTPSTPFCVSLLYYPFSIFLSFFKRFYLNFYNHYLCNKIRFGLIFQKSTADGWRICQYLVPWYGIRGSSLVDQTPFNTGMTTVTCGVCMCIFVASFLVFLPKSALHYYPKHIAHYLLCKKKKKKKKRYLNNYWMWCLHCVRFHKLNV
jgi:hypothetical protein